MVPPEVLGVGGVRPPGLPRQRGILIARVLLFVACWFCCCVAVCCSFVFADCRGITRQDTRTRDASARQYILASRTRNREGANRIRDTLTHTCTHMVVQSTGMNFLHRWQCALRHDYITHTYVVGAMRCIEIVTHGKVL